MVSSQHRDGLPKINNNAQGDLRRSQGSFDPLATPDFFPTNLDVKRNVIKFDQMSREAFRESLFLDRQIVRAGKTTLMAEMPKLSTRPARLPLQFILHVAFCGSTLLARYLETLPHCLVLKEPGVLSQLSLMENRISTADDPRSWGEWFKVTMALLSRGYPEHHAVVIKAADMCNWMGSLFLDHNEETKIVFLFIPLRMFLLQTLKVDHRRRWLREHMQVLRRSMARVPFLVEVDVADLTDGRCAAAMWLTNAYLCRSLLERPNSHHVLVLSGDRLISQPGEGVFAAADHLGLLPDESSRNAIRELRPLSHHSKDEQLAYDASTWTAELADVEARHGIEVDAAMSWAVAASSGWLAASPFPLE